MTNGSRRYKGYPLRSVAVGDLTGGFSDHFPVYVYLVKEITEAEETKATSDNK